MKVELSRSPFSIDTPMVADFAGLGSTPGLASASSSGFSAGRSSEPLTIRTHRKESLEFDLEGLFTDAELGKFQSVDLLAPSQDGEVPSHSLCHHSSCQGGPMTAHPSWEGTATLRGSWHHNMMGPRTSHSCSQAVAWVQACCHGEPHLHGAKVPGCLRQPSNTTSPCQVQLQNARHTAGAAIMFASAPVAISGPCACPPAAAEGAQQAPWCNPLFLSLRFPLAWWETRWHELLQTPFGTITHL